MWDDAQEGAGGAVRLERLRDFDGIVAFLRRSGEATNVGGDACVAVGTGSTRVDVAVHAPSQMVLVWRDLPAPRGPDADVARRIASVNLQLQLPGFRFDPRSRRLWFVVTASLTHGLASDLLGQLIETVRGTTAAHVRDLAPPAAQPAELQALPAWAEALEAS